ncbi:hypothetical protein DFJ74DRAFT_731838 [Hyaloraphidium curvatum]|nr:hypothetical protein DFJ74DRAFT_731838 [Hyaloraphidium curvatum]
MAARPTLSLGNAMRAVLPARRAERPPSPPTDRDVPGQQDLPNPFLATPMPMPAKRPFADSDFDAKRPRHTFSQPAPRFAPGRPDECAAVQAYLDADRELVGGSQRVTRFAEVRDALGAEGRSSPQQLVRVEQHEFYVTTAIDNAQQDGPEASPEGEENEDKDGSEPGQQDGDYERESDGAGPVAEGWDPYNNAEVPITDEMTPEEAFDALEKLATEKMPEISAGFEKMADRLRDGRELHAKLVRVVEARGGKIGEEIEDLRKAKARVLQEMQSIEQLFKRK